MPLVASRSLLRLTSRPKSWAIPAYPVGGRRVGGYKYISVQSTPSAESTRIGIQGRSTAVSSPDASFEVLGSPYSLLAVTLSPSQDLYTRRGTLIGLAREPDNIVSTLRLLSPVRRLLLGIPFLYQKVTSTTPTSLLISPKSPITSFVVLHLDGTIDWQITQRKGLVAWTGKTLNITPTLNMSLSLAHYGNVSITGRGLLALAGQGQIFTLDLAPGESYVAHPSHVLGYSTTSTPKPVPYRFKSRNVSINIPLSLGNWFPEPKFWRDLKNSDTWRMISSLLLRIRTWSRRTIWGDRLFLRFEGPTTILLQSRGSAVREILSSREVNEIADAPAGAVEDVLYDMRKTAESQRTGVHGARVDAPTKLEQGAGGQPKLTVKEVTGDGKVKFEAVNKS